VRDISHAITSVVNRGGHLDGGGVTGHQQGQECLGQLADHWPAWPAPLGGRFLDPSRAPEPGDRPWSPRSGPRLNWAASGLSADKVRHHPFTPEQVSQWGRRAARRTWRAKDG
jgi:hypothetical protein